MMLWFMLFVVFMHSYLVDSEHLSYCNTKVCPFGDEHTFCQFKPGPGTLCKGYMPVPLSRDEQITIVAKLNKRRSENAKYEPQAANVMKMYWVKSLAAEAQIWADQCRPAASPEEHDGCRNLYSVSVGQCVGSVVGDAPGLRPGSFVDMWLLQSSRHKGNMTSGKPNKNCDDFIQIIAANSYMVGCGRSQFQTDRHGRLQTVQRLVCNFAPRGLHAGAKSLWSAGPPASDCPAGARPDAEYPELCSFGQTSREIEEELNKREYEWSGITNSKKVRRFLSNTDIAETSVSKTPTIQNNFTTHESVTLRLPSISSQKSLNISFTLSPTETTEDDDRNDTNNRTVLTENVKVSSFGTEAEVVNNTDDDKISSSSGHQFNAKAVDTNKIQEKTNKTHVHAYHSSTISVLKQRKVKERSSNTNRASVDFNNTDFNGGKMEMILRYVTRSEDFRKFNKSARFSFCVILYYASFCVVILCSFLFGNLNII